MILILNTVHTRSLQFQLNTIPIALVENAPWAWGGIVNTKLARPRDKVSQIKFFIFSLDAEEPRFLIVRY